MCEFHRIVLHRCSLHGFKTFRNLEGCLPTDSFIHHVESGFLVTRSQGGPL